MSIPGHLEDEDVCNLSIVNEIQKATLAHRSLKKRKKQEKVEDKDGWLGMQLCYFLFFLPRLYLMRFLLYFVNRM